MGNKTTKLKKLFDEWHEKQQKSNFENPNHFSEDGLIKGDDEECSVLFVLAEPRSNENKRNPDFWFRSIWEDSDRSYYNDSNRSNKRNITKYKNRITLCAESIGLTKEDILNGIGIAVMDMKKCGAGSHLSKINFDRYIEEFAEFIKKQIEILAPKHIIACGNVVLNALNKIGLDEEITSKIIQIPHLGARCENSKFILRITPENKSEV